MKNPFYKRKKFWKRLVFFLVALPVLIFSLLITIVYFKQDAIVQAQINSANQTFEGKIEVGESHLAPFENFPLISIKVDEVKVFENKDDTTQSILNVKDIYAGFNLWDLLSGNIIVKALTVEDGFFNIIQHTDGSLNLTNALKTADTSKSTEPLNLSIEKIALQNLDVHKLNESNNLDVETFINYANGGFKTINNHIKAHVDTKFEMNINSNGDTTYVKHKHFELHTDVDFDQDKGWLVIEPSGLILENADFNLVALINDVFHAVPFAFKVALFHPETESNLQTRFIEQICFSKGIIDSFFNCEETAEVWLEHVRTPEISFSRKNMSI